MSEDRSLAHAGFPTDDEPSNPSHEPSLLDIARARLSRRGVLTGIAAGAVIAALPRLGRAEAPPAEGPGRFGFRPVPTDWSEDHRVAAGHRAEVLVRWGDPVLGDAPPFHADRLEAADQERQFGTHNDFTAFLPLPRGSGASDRGLLCVNHEYAEAMLMWPDETERGSRRPERIRYEMAAHGHSVIEVARENGSWSVRAGSPYARRITATTPTRLSGPVRGHRRVRTTADPRGERVEGTFANCGGGVTPWGTVLTAEENFHEYFSGDPARAGEESAALTRYGFGKKAYHAWSLVSGRFDLEREPREANRFGWIVELDPYDPDAPPVKRTALGRFKHEAACTTLNGDGRVVVYSGDDQVFEYVYRFVSDGRFDPDRREANGDLLDAGTLFAARFEADGTVRWLPLVFGSGPLVPRNGFRDQGDVLIEARRAAQLLGATPMDRPEDVEVDPRTGRVYVMLTNNADRTPSQVDAANPRAFNRLGHVLEITPPPFDGLGLAPVAGASPRDHATLDGRWDLLSLGEDGAPCCPDGAAFDGQGRLWVATDQGDLQAERAVADGLWGLETEGPARGTARLFYACPRGAEMCGPTFTPDGRTLFVAVQHPGAGPLGSDAKAPKGTFAAPATRWPDFADGVPPRSAIVVITREDGGPVGS